MNCIIISSNANEPITNIVLKTTQSMISQKYVKKYIKFVYNAISTSGKNIPFINNVFINCLHIITSHYKLVFLINGTKSSIDHRSEI